MSGAHRMILCTLALLSGGMALTAKESPGKAVEPKVAVSADGFVDKVTATNGVTTATTTEAPAKTLNKDDTLQKVTATIGVTAAATTAAPALEKNVPPADSTSIVGKAAAAVGTAMSVATSLAAATTSITCPDGFAKASAAGNCCASQFVKHFDKAKLLCESEPGWKTFEASPESFNCCQVSTATASPVAPAPAPAPVKAPVNTQAAVVKKPEVAPVPTSSLKLAEAPPSLKALPPAPTHSPGFNSAAAVTKGAHLEQLHAQVKELDGRRTEIQRELQRATTMSPRHRDHQLPSAPDPLVEELASFGNSQHVMHLSSHHRHHEASHSANRPKYDSIIMSMETEPVPKGEAAGGWETWHYMVLAVLIVAVWLNMPGGDMRKVPVPGYGDVDFMGEKNPEKCDLFGSGYTANSYGGAAVKQPVAMKNPVGDYRFNNFNDDDIGL